MNPTAEDILNKHSTDTTTKGRVRFTEALAAMAEYSLLKSKEAADKAWEAGSMYEYAEHFGPVPHTFPDKETFMKELFKPVTI